MQEKMTQEQECFICVDQNFHLDSIVIQSSSDLIPHMSHQGLKQFKVIHSQLEENKDIVNEFLSLHDLESQLKYLDEKKEALEKNSNLRINLFIEHIKTLWQDRFLETQRLKDVLNSILTDDVKKLEKIKGDFSFLYNIQEFPELSAKIESPNIKARKDIERITLEMNQFWEGRIDQADLNLLTIQDKQEELRLSNAKVTQKNEQIIESNKEHTYPNGNIYKGEWCDEKKHGKGEFTWPSGDKYIGNYNDDTRDGYGELCYKSGGVYKGQWQNDKKHGKGEFVWSSGAKYIGNFKDDKLDGYGEKYYTDGKVYKGQWKNDLESK